MNKIVRVILVIALLAGLFGLFYLFFTFTGCVFGGFVGNDSNYTPADNALAVVVVIAAIFIYLIYKK